VESVKIIFTAILKANQTRGLNKLCKYYFYFLIVTFALKQIVKPSMKKICGKTFAYGSPVKVSIIKIIRNK